MFLKSKLKQIIYISLVVILLAPSLISTNVTATGTGEVSDLLVENCATPALMYIECDDIIDSINMDRNVKILVMDNGLSIHNWQHLESRTEIDVDIVKYIGYDNSKDQYLIENGVIGNDINFQNSKLVSSNQPYDHATAVISTIGQIARGVQIVFVAVNQISEPNLNFDYGNSYEMEKLWDAVTGEINNGIDIITWSHGIPYEYDGIDFENSVFGNTNYQTFKNEADLHEVVLINSAGNQNIDLSDHESYRGSPVSVLPKIYDEWWAIGSVDHVTVENQVCSPRESVQGERSYFSNYGSTNPNDGDSIKFSMPGHCTATIGYDYIEYDKEIINGGVGSGRTTVDPETWYLRHGTSFSAPMLAAAVAVGIDRYRDGQAYYGNLAQLSKDEIFSLLKDSTNHDTSSPTFNYETGWGHVYLTEVYDLFFNFAGKDLGELQVDIQSASFYLGSLERLYYSLGWYQNQPGTVYIKLYRSSDSSVTTSDSVIKSWSSSKSIAGSYSYSTNTVSSYGHYYYRPYYKIVSNGYVVDSFWGNTIYNYRAQQDPGDPGDPRDPTPCTKICPTSR